MEQDDRLLRGDAPEETCEEDVREDCRGGEAGEVSDDCAFVASGDLVVRDMPELKVLGYLQNGTGTLDVGKTIQNLFVSMQNMDAHLNSVLAINAVLEKDIRASKDVITRLNAEKSQMEEAAAKLRDEMPSKRELQAEIEHLIEERNEAQASIRSRRQQVEKTLSEMQGLKDRVVELGHEKADLTKDIEYLEIKLGAAVEKLNAYAREITVLKGEKVSNLEKYEKLRLQYGKCMEENKGLLLKNTMFGEGRNDGQ